MKKLNVIIMSGLITGKVYLSYFTDIRYTLTFQLPVVRPTLSNI